MRLLPAFVIATLLVSSMGPKIAQAEPRTATLIQECWAHRESVVDCLVPAGQTTRFFRLNGLSLLTVQTSYEPNGNGGRRGWFNTDFSTSRLRVGSNLFEFDAVSQNPAGAKLDHEVYLHGLGSPVLLFQGRSNGSDYSGETSFAADLATIDPALAMNLSRLRDLVRMRIDELRAAGRDEDRALIEIPRLERLLDELEAILELGFDQTNEEHLAAILADYMDLTPELLGQLRQVLRDMRVLVDDLRREIQEINQAFEAWVDELVGPMGGRPEFTDEELTSPPQSPLPEVEWPDILDHEFDDEHDPYRTFADQVIEQLSTTIDPESGRVALRGQFLSIVSAWRLNVQTLRAALEARSVVSQSEWGAFLTSQTRVATFLAPYMNQDGWFTDTGIPQELMELVDAGLVDPRALRLKNALNLNSQLDAKQAAVALAVAYTLYEYGRIMQVAQAEARLQRMRDAQETLWESTVSFFENAAVFGWDVALTITPLGDVVDICEAVTGKEGCNIFTGADLSWQQRALAAAGLLVWGGTSAVRRMSRAFDRACDIARRSGLTLAGVPLPCGADAFMSRLDRALENVPDRAPRSNYARDPRYHRDGTVTYYRSADLGGGNVTFSKSEKGFPLFERRHLHPSSPDVPKPEVWVEFFCDNTSEFRQANAANGRTRTPGGHTWHHSHEFRKRGGKVQIKMQLVESTIHDWSRHSGGMSIGRQILGRDFCA
jgi:hypothetical protein